MSTREGRDALRSLGVQTLGVSGAGLMHAPRLSASAAAVHIVRTGEQVAIRQRRLPVHADPQAPQ